MKASNDAWILVIEMIVWKDWESCNGDVLVAQDCAASFGHEQERKRPVVTDRLHVAHVCVQGV